jgi:hypothetical protein
LRRGRLSARNEKRITRSVVEDISKIKLIN